MDVKSTEEGDSGAADPRKGTDLGPSDPPDAELLRRSARGDGSAFRELMDRHADWMFRLAASLVGNPADAEDVLQKRSRARFGARGSFRAGLP